MTLRVSFDLGDADLQHFEALALQTQALAREHPEDAIIAAARAVFEKGAQARAAHFVRERYARLGLMLEMVADPAWLMSVDDRQRLINALACFSTPTDVEPLSVLDHAIMIELVSRDLQHDLDAYRDFCKFRESRSMLKRSAAPSADRERWLEQKRESLQARMHKRRKRDLDAAPGAVKKLFSLLGL